MCKRFIIFLLLFAPIMVKGQVGVDFHVSNIPFVSVNYEFFDRLRGELRVGVDTHIENIPLEGIFTFDFLNKTEYELYAGLGARSGDFSGLVVPVGCNFYPFQEKRFGFHIELAPIFGEFDILRGSAGIRYRFQKE